MTRKVPPGPVRRWADAEPESDVDAELKDAFLTLQGSEPLDHATLAAVGRRIALQRSSSARRPFRFLPLVVAVLTCGTGAAFAQWSHDSGWNVQQLFGSAPQPSRRDAPVATPKPAPAPAPALAATSDGLAAVAPPAISALPAATSVPAAPPLAGAATRPSALGLESELLQKALAKLRREHDAPATLALLDDYQSRFPRGMLSLEASVARVDALLLAGRRSDALERLSRLPLERVGRRVELQLLRAELYAERDCKKALPDFAAVLAAAPAGAFGERALYGRATCRLRSGDSAGGNADLRSYLERFPKGRFAQPARARTSAAR